MIELRCAKCGSTAVSVDRPMGVTIFRSHFICQCGDHWAFDLHLVPAADGTQHYVAEGVSIDTRPKTPQATPAQSEGSATDDAPASTPDYGVTSDDDAERDGDTTQRANR